VTKLSGRDLAPFDLGPTASLVTAVRSGDGELVAMAHSRAATETPTGYTVALSSTDAEATGAVLADLTSALPPATAVTDLWMSGPTDADHQAILAAGYEAVREVVQLRAPLPVPSPEGSKTPPTDVVWRTFVDGDDDREWLAVNQRAFSFHPDQGDMGQADLDRAKAEPWFDPEGFLIVDDADGTMLGFCWTKVHHDHDPVLGEIYVIGVDPSAHGRGLGRALVTRGLHHLAQSGITNGMLYVESDNVAANGLYAALGFTRHHSDRRYLPVTATHGTAP
jgi:mycothiol synthase